DPRLLTGAAKYVADLGDELAALGAGTPLYAHFVRSEVPHGVLRAVDTSDAAALPGVAAAWTAAELGVAAHHGFVKVHDDFAPAPLADDRVRFVGEAFAVVFADSPAAAADAAQAVWAEIDPLPAATDAESALAAGAEPLYAGHPTNLAIGESPDAPLDLA